LEAKSCICYRIYPERPPTKLHNWKGPTVIQRIEANTYFCQDLITMVCQPINISRSNLFCHRHLDHHKLICTAAYDKDEEIVEAILTHKGNPRKRKTLYFLVHWLNFPVVFIRLHTASSTAS
jgi:hypothetical protein